MRETHEADRRHACVWLSLHAAPLSGAPSGRRGAQGVTTGQISGHRDSTSSSSPSRAPASSRFTSRRARATRRRRARMAGSPFPNMRVGGPYTVTVAYTGRAARPRSSRTTHADVVVNLGVATDLPLTVRADCGAGDGHGHGAVRHGVQLGPHRRGDVGEPLRNRDAAHDVGPHRRRHAPDAAGEPVQSFAGQDNRLNNITVDGSYFNNSFGLAGAAGRPHRRRADFARSDRADSGQRRAVRRAAGQLRRRRRQHRHPQRHQPADRRRSITGSATRTSSGPTRRGWRSTPARSISANTGGWAGGPILRNKLFAFGNYEDEDDTRPLTNFRANAGGEPVARQHDARARRRT